MPPHSIKKLNIKEKFFFLLLTISNEYFQIFLHFGLICKINEFSENLSKDLAAKTSKKVTEHASLEGFLLWAAANTGFINKDDFKIRFP